MAQQQQGHETSAWIGAVAIEQVVGVAVDNAHRCAPSKISVWITEFRGTVGRWTDQFHYRRQAGLMHHQRQVQLYAESGGGCRDEMPSAKSSRDSVAAQLCCCRYRQTHPQRRPAQTLRWQPEAAMAKMVCRHFRGYA